jgi:hypothetical protein
MYPRLPDSFHLDDAGGSYKSLAASHRGKHFSNLSPLTSEDTRAAVFRFISTLLRKGNDIIMKNAVFWDVTPCGSCKNRRFEGT